MYVYIESRKWIEDEGHKHRPDKGFETESEHSDKTRAAARVHYLNGGVWDRKSEILRDA